MWILLILTLLAVGAHADTAQTAYSCQNGLFAPVTQESECLPHIPSVVAGGNVTDTTADATATVVQTSGTFTCCVFPAETAEGSYPTGDQIIANTGTCIQKQDVTVSGTAVSLTGGDQFTGLTAEDMLKTACVHVVGVKQSLVDISNTFSTNATPGGGGTDLTGAGLFIAKADGGNTDETPTGTAGTQISGCTSMANSCSEFSHASPAIEQDVFLAEGGVWEDTTLSIGVDGSSTDQSVWGCYFDEGDDNGNPVACSSF